MELDGNAPDATDNANYFCEYGYMYHQMDMLEDVHRTSSYFNAVTSNAACFQGKVVLDVGAGTCILAMIAAKAGARQVFAVEATDMAQRAKRVVEANGLSDVVRVIQGTVETVELPCKVDIIISEWMGYFLLRESMLDCVLVARDRWLKPGGALYPSHATLYLAPVCGVKSLKDKWQEWQQQTHRWETFDEDMKKWYDIDFACLHEDFDKEQNKFYLQTATFVNLTPKQLLGPAQPLLELDLVTQSLADLQDQSEPCRCSMRFTRDGIVDGFAGYFDAFFRGSPTCPVEEEVVLHTSPTTGVSSHWGQQVFGFYPPIAVKQDDTLDCVMLIRRQKINPRLLRLETKFTHCRPAAGKAPTVLAERNEVYFVD